MDAKAAELEIQQNKSSMTDSSSQGQESVEAIRQETKTEDLAQPPPPAPAPVLPQAPNGGTKAWLQVLGAWGLWFGSWGLIQSFGTFQTYYQLELIPTVSLSTISWIGSVQGFLLMFGGLVSGPLLDRGYFRLINLIGCFMMVFGMMMTSICTEFYQLFLAQGICVGIGMGLTYVPAASIIATFFSPAKRAMAIGIGATGIGAGGIIYPILFRQIQPQIGFGWTMRVIGFLNLALFIPGLIFLNPLFLPPRPRKVLDFSGLKDPAFAMFTLGGFLAVISIFTPAFYVSLFSITELHMGSNLAFYLLAVLNAGMIFGRLVPGIIAMYIGPLNILTITTIFCSMLMFCWIAVTSNASVIVFCAFYGLFAGALVSLGPTCCASMTDDIRQISGRIGVGFATMAPGMLPGNPIAGALLGSDRNKFLKLQIFAAAVTMIAGSAFLATGLIQMRKKRTWKV